MAVLGCSNASAAPEHGGADASTDAPLASDGGDADNGFDSSQDVPTCVKSADCMGGQICCENLTARATLCQMGPCPATGSVQLCATAADCFVAGDDCIGTRFPFGMCTAPAGDSGPPIADAEVADVAIEAGVYAPDSDAAADTGTDAALDGGPADAGGAL
jgi:hypothetical protein